MRLDDSQKAAINTAKTILAAIFDGSGWFGGTYRGCRQYVSGRRLRECQFEFGGIVNGGSIKRAANELAELVSINLAFAQAEIAMIGDRESVLRALDHVCQAKAGLKILAAELAAPADETEEEVA